MKSANTTQNSLASIVSDYQDEATRATRRAHTVTQLYDSISRRQDFDECISAFEMIYSMNITKDRLAILRVVNKLGPGKALSAAKERRQEIDESLIPGYEDAQLMDFYRRISEDPTRVEQSDGKTRDRRKLLALSKIQSFLAGHVGPNEINFLQAFVGAIYAAVRDDRISAKKRPSVVWEATALGGRSLDHDLVKFFEEIEHEAITDMVFEDLSAAKGDSNPNFRTSVRTAIKRKLKGKAEDVEGRSIDELVQLAIRHFERE